MGLSKWTTEMTSKFISLYREQECLWRNDSLIYRNKDARDTALKNIIDGMNLQDLTIDDVKKKIKHLRCTYMIEVKKIERSVRSRAGTSTIYKPSLAWFAEMDAFIKYLSVTRETKSSSIQQPNIENPEQQQDCQKRHADNPDRNQPSQTARNKRSRLSQLSTAVKDKEDTNEFEVYGKYVGVQLKCMDEEDAILAQQEIQSILTKYKLKKVQRNRHIAGTQSMSLSQSRHSDYQSLASPSDGRVSADSNSQSCRPSYYDSPTSYDNDYTFQVNETDMAAVAVLRLEYIKR